MNIKKKIVITGGHATPALAVCEEIRRRTLPYEIVWVGRIRAFEDDTVESEEYRLVSQLGLRFLPLTTGRLTRVLSPASITSWLKVPYGFMQAYLYCRRERPDIILSFGGYIALPVAVAGWLTGTPVVTHEQTSSMGLANRLIGKIATSVCVSHTWMLKELPGKGVYTGLPIRTVFFHPPEKLSFRLSVEAPILFVTGGSTGSESINSVLFTSLPQLLNTYTVVHQTGKQGVHEAENVKNGLLPGMQKRYHAFSYLSESDIAWLFHRSRIVVARSGANTVGELAVSGAVALFIPLPWAVGDEQKKNAQARVNAGCARILEQSMLTTATLVSTLSEIEAGYTDLKRNAKKNTDTYPADASSKIADIIHSLIP